MNLRKQKLMAVKLLKAGKDRIWFNPAKLKEISEAISREDIRKMIEKGYIKKLPVKGTSRVRAREWQEKKRRGRLRGPGRKKGKSTRTKEDWINTIRPIRRFIKALRARGIIDRHQYRRLYLRAKGGFFRNKTHLKLYLKKEGVQF